MTGKIHMSQNVMPGAPTPAVPRHREPLNLPRGSVRAGLVLLIVLPFWVMLLSPARLGPMPLYLYFLLGLVLVYVAAQGRSATEDRDETTFSFTNVLFLLLSIVGTLAVVGYCLATKPPEFWADRLQPPPNAASAAPYLLLATLGGYSVGWLISHLLGEWRNIYWWQDVQASISLLAMFLLSFAFVLTVFIQAPLPEMLDITVFESILVAVVAWYFGARS
jgi:hypothetical protein